MTPVFIKTTVLQELMSDPVWAEKAQQCRNVEELSKVIAEFGKAKGLKVIYVPL